MTTHYRDWTAAQVRDQLIEAAQTTAALPGNWRPAGLISVGPETVKEAFKDEKTTEAPRRVPSAGELSRMEAAWVWINALEHEEERRLVYEWTEAKALGRGYLAKVMERNELTERTLRRAVGRICQRIADGLNRKSAIRLTMPVDAVAAMRDLMRTNRISVKNYAPRKSPTAVREFGRLTNDTSEEGVESFKRHLQRVNRSRRNAQKREAERKAKAAKRQKVAA